LYNYAEVREYNLRYDRLGQPLKGQGILPGLMVNELFVQLIRNIFTRRTSR
jgi:hypothetical protein